MCGATKHHNATQRNLSGLNKPLCRLEVTKVRQLYKNISMLFLFPVKDGKLSTGVNATFHHLFAQSTSNIHVQPSI